ncbi:MAG: aminopeptidase P N-terminal domain-containing protein [Leptolyngbyaceae bacterium]|nr:aminopeptidase P N-terminal domain-containing protein [Leptolyngbyaceae bacterium]
MQNEYAQRRQRLMATIGKGTAVFRSAPTVVHHHTVDYNFRQDSDFYYLTGFTEPEAVAVLAPHHEEHQFVLFVRPKDLEKETWSGRRLGVEAAKEKLGADEVYSIDELDEKLPQYLANADCIYYRMGRDRPFNDKMVRHWQRLMAQYQKRGVGPTALADPRPLTHPLRQVKSESELALMRQAIAISVEAHHRAMAMAAPGCYEYEIQAAMEHLFRRSGGEGPAYPSIVASGVNACILHYTENTRQMQAQDLLLIDAGCCYQYYNADITRTYPVAGEFTKEQQIIYEIVLEAQMQAIAQAQPGKPYSAMHDTAVGVIVDGLMELGLLQGDREEIIKEEKYKPFYMHRTGHWLGLDVHDAGVYKQGDTDHLLAAGQVFTVEPGIYISPEIKPVEGQPDVDERWLGIGIRIEDDVLMTATDHDVLTAAVPKQVDDLLQACRSGLAK